MDKGLNRIKDNIRFMMNRKTLAGIASLAALGVVAAQNAPTFSQVKQAIQQNPTQWTVVIGQNALAADVIGAADIIAAMEMFTAKPQVQSLNLSGLQVTLQSTAPTVPGYQLSTTTTPFYIGSYLNSVYTLLSVGSGSLTQTFPDGTTQTVDYSVYVAPGNAQFQFNNLGTNGAYNPQVFLNAGSATSQLLNVEVYFEPALNVTNLQYQPIQISILNTSYYLIYSNNYLKLVPAAAVATLQTGQNYTYNGVTVQFAGAYQQYTSSSVSSAQAVAQLVINGQTYQVPVSGSITVNGITITVISLSTALGSYVYTGQLLPGSVELVFSSSGSGYAIPISTSNVGPAIYTLSGTGIGQSLTNAQVSGSVTTSAGSILLSQLTFTIEPQEIGTTGYYGVVEGSSYQLPVFSNYQLSFAPVQLPVPGSSQISVLQSGTSGYTLTYTDAATGLTYTLNLYKVTSSSTSILLPFSQTLSTSAVQIVNASTGASVTSGSVATITGSGPYNVLVPLNGYFVVANPSLNQSSIYQVSSITNTSTGYQATLLNAITGQSITVYSGVPAVLDGIPITVIITNTSEIELANVTALANEMILYGEGNVQLTLNELGSSSVTLSVGKAYTGYSVSPTNIQLTLSATGGISAPSAPSGTLYSAAAGSSQTDYLDQAGAFVQYTSSSPESAYIYVPSAPLTLQVTLQPTSAAAQYQTETVGVGGTIDGWQVVGISGVPTQYTTYAQPTPMIGNTIFDTQVSSGMQNLIVVGGPCVNDIAAELLKVPYQTCGSALANYNTTSMLTPGNALMEVFTAPYGLSVLIAGYEAENTIAASKIFALYLAQGYDAAQLDNQSAVVVSGSNYQTATISPLS